MMHSRRTPFLIAALTVLLGLLAWSGWRPYERGTWALEVFPIVLAVPILWATYRRFPLTTLVYVCIFLHATVLMAGGAYTYARVPLGFAIQKWMGLGRNPYDKIGHFFQGFAPALVAREILIRGRYVRGRGMTAFLVMCVVMTISAVYELIEWATALLLGQGADDFLGTQGDIWDTQSDMFCALVGGTAALVFFSAWHHRQMDRLAGSGEATGRDGEGHDGR